MPAQIISVRSGGSVAIPEDIRKKVKLKEKDKMLIFNENGFIIGVEIPKERDEALVKLMNLTFKKTKEQKDIIKKLEKLDRLLNEITKKSKKINIKKLEKMHLI